LGKSRIRRRAGASPEADDFFHWHDESPLAALDVDRDSLRDLLYPLAYGPLSSDISRKRRNKFRRIMGKTAETIPVRIATLLEACELLNMEPNSLEKLKLFRGRYPIPLAQPGIYKLMTHVINEGSVKGGRNPRGVYCNLDLSLHERVLKLIHSLGSHGNRRIGKDNVPETYVSVSIARLLIKAGLIPGKKTRGQYFHHLPNRILDDPDLSRYHMSTTLTEEGFPRLSISKSKRLSISIGYTRSIDVTDLLPHEYINNMDKGKKYSFGLIPDEIRPRVLHIPFPLLEDEVKTIDTILDIEVHISPRSLYRSKQDRVTEEWSVTFSGAEVIERFAEKIGFLPDSKVEKTFQLMRGFFNEYKGKALSQEEVDRIKIELGRA